MAAVARRQAVELSRWFDVSLISEPPLTEIRAPTRLEPIAPPSFYWLRRYGHVAREIAFARAARRALRGLHARRPIDVVLCHAHVVAVRAAAPLTAACGVPYALVTHGDIRDRPAGTYGRNLSALYRRSTDEAYRLAARVLALSPHMAECALRSGARPESVCVIPNGVDAEDFGLISRDEWTPPEASGALRLLFVGRLAIEKGVDRLVDALALLPRDRDRFRLELIGDGPLAEELSLRARQIGVAALVRWSPAVPRRELASKYLASHLVCVPSRSDPLPTVALEAARAGRAVLASCAGGLPFIVQHDVTGVLVADGSAEAWARAIAELEGDRMGLARLGRSARERALADFNWTQIGQRLREVLESLVTKGGVELDASALTEWRR